MALEQYYPLTDIRRETAIELYFVPFDLPTTNYKNWDNYSYFASTYPYAYRYDTFVIPLTAGATYDVMSQSFYDPYLLRIYDDQGRIVAHDQAQGPRNTDVILDFVPEVTGNYYISASWHQGSLTSQRLVLLSIYENLDTVPVPGPIVENTTMPTHYGTAAVDVVDIDGSWQNTTFRVDDNEVFLSTEHGLRQNFVDVERFVFDDIAVAIDINGNAGQAYRLYQAAFDRTPDAKGLGYWIHELDRGVSLESIAAEFIRSEEFHYLYGDDFPDADFVHALYINVLDRYPDLEGDRYWNAQLDQGIQNREQVLAFFADSDENKAKVLAEIQNGIQYDVWV